MPVITNKHRREVIDASALTEEEQQQFDYYDWWKLLKGEDSASFVRYKGELYDLADFLLIDYPYFGRPVSEWQQEWDGIATDSFFSGLLVKYGRDDSGDYVVIGRWLS